MAFRKILSLIRNISNLRSLISTALLWKTCSLIYLEENLIIKFAFVKYFLYITIKYQKKEKKYKKEKEITCIRL